MSTSDPFETSDAAYVMGLLRDDERQAFEEHAVTCDACERRVGELLETAGLLSHVSEADLLTLDQQLDPAAAMPTVPETLLPSLLRQASVTRRRQRRVTFTLSGLVAACLIALACLLVLPSSDPQTRHPAALAPVVATKLRATATLSARSWGTEVHLDCRYPRSTAANNRHAFGLVVIDAKGARQFLGTWTILAGTQTEFSSGTALTQGQVRKLQITDLAGRPVLSLDV